MINTMECAVDAQSLISISLRKIHNSRTQRGGIKLHKNLLVSYVLRNARQVYMNEKYAEIYRMQQYEEVMTVCNEIQELDPLEIPDDGEEPGGGECCGIGGEASSLCGALLPVHHHHHHHNQNQHHHHHHHHQVSSVPVPVQATPLQTDEACKPSEPTFYRSCCAESCDFSSAHCNKTTVLDLDTHVVTTVENLSYLHQDCCAAPTPTPVPQTQASPSSSSPPPPVPVAVLPLQPCAKKRKADFGYYASEPDTDLSPELTPDLTPCKRAKFDDCSYPGSEALDTSNISNLISIFGSGFSGLVSRQTDFEQAFNGHFCSKQALASIGAWTRAIVAF